MRIAIAALTGFVFTVVGANWALSTFGIVSIGFGLAAPAGVYFAGAAFTFRDFVHDTSGRKGVLVAIVIGALLSWWLEPVFAIASGTAFLVSELADYSVYAPLRRKTWLGAVALSNSIGLLVDSALFLWLAFGSLAFIEGQVVGKFYMTALAIVLIWSVRRAVSIRQSRVAVV